MGDERKERTCMADHELPGAMPAPSDIGGNKEILGKGQVGVEAALHLVGVVPETGSPINLKKELKGVKDVIGEGKHPKLSRINKSSLEDRRRFWSSEEFKDLEMEDRWSEWE